MPTLTLLLLVTLVVLGLLVYVLAGRAEAKELGRLLFFAALLVLLFAVAGGRTPL